jgi:hypothetical protein
VREAVTEQLGAQPKTRRPLTLSFSEAGESTWQ